MIKPSYSSLKTFGERRYQSQDLKKLWSSDEYSSGYKNVKWTWNSLPFSNSLSSKDYLRINVTKKINNISILEVGSAMGSAYNFLKKTSLIDISQYTGIEVSNDGYNYSRKNYTEANWVNTDFTQYDLNKKFDYSFERHAVHHMPNPIRQYEKILNCTNVAAMFIFRGCIHGSTISDLDKACYFDKNGQIYCDIINIFDVISLGVNLGFNDIRVSFGGIHEPFSRDFNLTKKNRDNIFVDQSINIEKRRICRFSVRLRKTDTLKKIRIYLTKGPRVFFQSPISVLKLGKGLRNLKNFYNTSQSYIFL